MGVCASLSRPLSLCISLYDVVVATFDAANDAYVDVASVVVAFVANFAVVATDSYDASVAIVGGVDGAPAFATDVVVVVVIDVVVVAVDIDDVDVAYVVVAATIAFFSHVDVA